MSVLKKCFEMRGLVYVLSLVALMLASSCLRLDDFLFNPNENEITEYKLWNYDGEQEFVLDSTYRIDPSMHHLLRIADPYNSSPDVPWIYALYIGDMDSIATDTVILYCHGNKDHLDFYYPRIQLLAHTGGLHRYGVMSIDYQGFGLSDGEPSEDALYEDVRTAVTWLKSKGLTPDRLILYGFSVGTAPATEYTANVLTPPSKLILEAPFASAEVFVQDGAGLSLPGTYLVNLQIDNAEEIRKVALPFLWIHGTADDFISMQSHGELVYKNYNGADGWACRVPNAGHSDVPVLLGYTEYLRIVEAFVTGNLSSGGTVSKD
jgi:pimeloyl-ACP methyl ester carboxylesterase